MEIFDFPSLSHKMPNPTLGRGLEIPSHAVSEQKNMCQLNTNKAGQVALYCIVKTRLQATGCGVPEAWSPDSLKLCGLVLNVHLKRGHFQDKTEKCGKSRVCESCLAQSRLLSTAALF